MEQFKSFISEEVESSYRIVVLSTNAEGKGITNKRIEEEAKKLNYHASRINTCAKWKKEGVLLTENSPLYGLCEDVTLVTPANTLIDHKHKITTPSSTSE